ncbi:MAG TPA: GAF and ANTAR domain-containing protein [Acidimicrobiales bacterium]|nr:GAF and ANTAR domain-containing protein [Acidimicrobiales bacterium]
MGDNNTSGATTEGVVGLAGALLDDEELHSILQRLTQLAQHGVATSRSASITVVQDGRYRTANSTGPEALAIDEAQYQESAGPCLEAIRSDRQLDVVVEEQRDDWPRFAQEALEAGVVGVLSTPLARAPGEVVGALNIYAGEAGGFGPADRRTAQLIGGLATILLARSLALLDSSRLNDQLRQALATREIIGEAKGILMESQSCTRDQAFDILRRASQRENRKLRDLANDLVERVEARADGHVPLA